MKNLLNFAVSTIVILGLTLTNYSCTPESAPKAAIQIIDENNEPVEGAKVCVKAINSDEEHTVVYLIDEDKPIEDVQYSDNDGFVYYDFKYESIYRVEVTVEADFYHENVRRGIGVLVLENNKIEEIIVEINEQTTF